MTKLASSLPKGDANGLDEQFRARMVKDPHQVHVVVALLDCSRVVRDVDNGVVQPTARICRVEVVTGDDAADMQDLLQRVFEQRTGKAELPLDLQLDVDKAFPPEVTTRYAEATSPDDPDADGADARPLRSL